MEYKLTFGKYNEALKRNKLMGLKCNDCQTITCPPKMTCQECTGTNLEVTELRGKGKIVTFTTIQVAPEGRENELPYTIVMVELDEGPWIIGNLIDIDPSKTGMELIGKKVKMGHKVFSGDKYSNGDAARPLFSFAD
ncbi:MAG TPA: nucleic acid-binding protein [Syntrophaceae bacterium]|jgi:uncharacterized OB-fold protein|nr:nucleic acid-binding protein [Syntrophaceae bacterium]HCX02675.1 nucleic acid-binding protein [Syntrophaceae bacterium]